MIKVKKILILGIGMISIPIHTVLAFNNNVTSDKNNTVENVQQTNAEQINNINQATRNELNKKVKPIKVNDNNLNDKIVGKVITDHDYNLVIPFKTGDKLNIANIDQVVENLKTNLSDAIVFIKPTEQAKIYDVIVNTKRNKEYYMNISVDNENLNPEGKDNLYFTVNRDHIFSYGDMLTFNYKYNLSHNVDEHSNSMWYVNYNIPIKKTKISISRYRNNQKVRTDIYKLPLKSYVDNTDINIATTYNRAKNRKLSYYLGSHHVASDYKINNIPLNMSRRHSTNFIFGWSGLYYGSNSALLINPNIEFIDKHWNNIPVDYNSNYVKSNLNVYYTKNYNIKEKHYDNYAMNMVASYSPVSQLSILQFSIGGLNSVRGFKDTSFSGDQGFYLRNTWTRNYKHWAPFIGLDMGNLYNLKYKESAMLAGVAMGFRYHYNHYNINVTLGYPLINKSYLAKEKAPIYFQMNYDF